MTDEQKKQYEELTKLKKKEEHAEAEKKRRQLKDMCKKEFGKTPTEIKHIIDTVTRAQEQYGVTFDELMKHVCSDTQVSYYRRSQHTMF